MEGLERGLERLRQAIRQELLNGGLVVVGGAVLASVCVITLCGAAAILAMGWGIASIAESRSAVLDTLGGVFDAIGKVFVADAFANDGMAICAQCAAEGCTNCPYYCPPCAAALKRVWKAEGRSEAEIHAIIPDRPGSRKAAPAAP